mgnify:CR=1 FL=1
MEIKEIIEGIKKEGIFDFIVNNYGKLTKEDLRDIAKELDYTLQDKFTKNEYDMIITETCKNLKELEN